MDIVPYVSVTRYSYNYSYRQVGTYLTLARVTGSKRVNTACATTTTNWRISILFPCSNPRVCSVPQLFTYPDYKAFITA